MFHSTLMPRKIALHIIQLPVIYDTLQPPINRPRYLPSN